MKKLWWTVCMALLLFSINTADIWAMDQENAEDDVNDSYMPKFRYSPKFLTTFFEACSNNVKQKYMVFQVEKAPLTSTDARSLFNDPIESLISEIVRELQNKVKEKKECNDADFSELIEQILIKAQPIDYLLWTLQNSLDNYIRTMGGQLQDILPCLQKIFSAIFLFDIVFFGKNHLTEGYILTAMNQNHDSIKWLIKNKIMENAFIPFKMKKKTGKGFAAFDVPYMQKQFIKNPLGKDCLENLLRAYTLTNNEFREECKELAKKAAIFGAIAGTAAVVGIEGTRSVTSFPFLKKHHKKFIAAALFTTVVVGGGVGACTFMSLLQK